MSEKQLRDYIEIGDAFAKIAGKATKSQVHTPSQIAELMIEANEHRRRMGQYHAHVYDRIKERKIDFAILAAIDATMAFPPFRYYCDWWSLLVEQLSVAPIQPESDPWVLVELADCKGHRSTLSRASGDPATTGVRKIRHGKYEIRRSRLAEYLDVRHRRKYGIE